MTWDRIIFTCASVTPAEKCPLNLASKSSEVVGASERTKIRGDEDRRNRGEGTVHGPKAKQLIANRHECMYSG